MSARRRPVRPWVRNDLPRRKSMSADRELTLTRLIDAPREKLYRAWTDPSLLKQWFAPMPYTTPVAELDVRPMRRWDFTRAEASAPTSSRRSSPRSDPHPLARKDTGMAQSPAPFVWY